MDPRLQLAIENDDVDVLHRLIVEDRNLLDRVSEEPFPNTPLHIASAAGKTQVAMEVAILKPSFARKLNPEGYSPMHLALQHEHYHTVRALMTLDPELIRVRGRCGITPLHYVSEKEGGDELELLAEFLSACRSSIEDLTSRCETAVHVAVKNHNFNAFKVLFGWLKRVHLTQILKWKDQDGNTVLHIAASEGQSKVIKLLIGWYTDVNAKNFEGKTALEIFQVNPSGGPDVAKTLRHLGGRARRLTPILSLSEFFSRELTPFEKCANYFRVPNESARNTILIVSTLVAAVSYQAALTPPGGYWQDSSSNPPANSSAVAIANSGGTAIEKPHRAGDIILSGSNLYIYTIYNGLTFFASIATIWATTFTLEAISVMASIFLPLFLISDTYLINFSIQFPGTAVGVLFGHLRLAILHLPLLLAMNHQGVRARIDATWRHIQDRTED